MKLPALGELWEAAASYVVVFLSALANVDWMHVGAWVLLVARLIHDVPLATQVIKDTWAKWKVKLRG